jgi:hypothetical protein
MKYTAHKAISTLFVLLLLVTVVPTSRSPIQAAASTRQEPGPPTAWVAPRGGQPFFVVGANYEGPVDRAWAMWEEEEFDPALIEADFARARSIGARGGRHPAWCRCPRGARANLRGVDGPRYSRAGGRQTRG